MAGSFTPTGSYSNLTRLELEQLQKADFFAGHDVCSPSWQKTQVPSEYANGMTTTSPAFMVRTSAPTASTRPMASCPMRRPVSLRSIVLYGQRSGHELRLRRGGDQQESERRGQHGREPSEPGGDQDRDAERRHRGDGIQARPRCPAKPTCLAPRRRCCPSRPAWLAPSSCCRRA